MDLTSFTIDNGSLARRWLIRESSPCEITTVNMKSVIDGLLWRVEHLWMASDTHVIIFYPIHLVGAYQVDERERQHGHRDEDHQALGQTPPENATLRAISSHEAVVCARAFVSPECLFQSLLHQATTHSSAGNLISLWLFVHDSFLRKWFNPRTKAITGRLLWTRSCTQSTNSTIIDDSDSRLVCFTNRCKLSADVCYVLPV